MKKQSKIELALNLESRKIVKSNTPVQGKKMESDVKAKTSGQQTNCLNEVASNTLLKRNVS